MDYFIIGGILLFIVFIIGAAINRAENNAVQAVKDMPSMVIPIGDLKAGESVNIALVSTRSFMNTADVERGSYGDSQNLAEKG